MALNTKISTRELVRQIPHRSSPSDNHKRNYLWFLLVSDALMLVLAFGLAYYLRFHLGIGLSLDVEATVTRYLRIVGILIPGWLAIFALLRLYDFRYLIGGTTEYARVANAVTSGMMLLVLASFIEESILIARAWLVMSWFFSILFICGSRMMLRRAVYFLRCKGFFIARSLIIGTNAEAQNLFQELKQSEFSGLSIQGFINEDAASSKKSVSIDDASGESLVSDKSSILGSLDNLAEVVKEKQIDEVIIATTSLSREQLLQVFEKIAHMPSVEMRLSSGLYEVITTNMRVKMFGTVPLMNLNRLRLDPIEAFLKRVLDCLVIFACFGVLIPLSVVISLLIKLDSPGPVLYRRRVLGVGGQEFDAFKFRTMHVNSDEILEQHPELKLKLEQDHKLRHDPRITRIGNILRSTSLDELPQLINVLMGQMSLVGPRMISPQESAKYGKMSANLLTVKPGMTGLWQVSGRSDLSYEERVRLDMHYIRNYSIWQDIQILFVQTPRVVLKREGAY